MTDINLLRRSLGLPLHKKMSDSIYHGYVCNEKEGPDVEDTDHEALTVESESPYLAVEIDEYFFIDRYNSTTETRIDNENLNAEALKKKIFMRLCFYFCFHLDLGTNFINS